MSWIPEACTLPTAERPLRLREFDAMFAEATRDVRRVSDDHLRVELAPSPEVASRVADLAARETSCCSFFTFTLTAASGALLLDVTVPAGHTDVLDGLAARVSS